MEMGTQDYLKKTLLDTQERVRDFMHFSEDLEDSQLKNFFSNYALTEAKQAQKLQQYIEVQKQ